MDRKKLLKHTAFLGIFILLINALALKLYWYSLMWYFDMPMHFLGGVWVGLLVLFILDTKKARYLSVTNVILGVLLIGVAWEVYEVVVNNLIAQLPFNTFDTLSDICFDLSGGALTTLWYYRDIVALEKNKIY